MLPANCYTRMFPDLPKQGSKIRRLEEGLIELGERMRDDLNKPPEHPTPLAGYTYLGQFIDHDLTLDITPVKLANPNTERIRNFRTPFLDLDHVYGAGPTLSPFLYQNKQEDHGAEKFLIGDTTPTKIGDGSFPSSPDDLPRNAEGIALAGDPRQDENLIVAQLHVVFLKLHNHVLDHLKTGQLQSLGPAGAMLFWQARRLVTWHYQWIVRNDYLNTILDPDVFKQLASRRYKPIVASPRDFRIPIEFSAAAFRFGHSMVRNQYLINTIDDAHKQAPLKNLLRLTGSGGGARPKLPADWKITWKFFVVSSGGTSTAQHSSAIDTRIAGGLYKLSGETRQLFSMAAPGQSMGDKSPNDRSPEDDLPVITLLRGARVGLPSGQRVAKEIARRKPGIRIINDDEIAQGAHEETLRKYGFHKDTPLWYYILKEAEVLQKGVRLGPVGSWVVADVIMNALLKDTDSYISAKPDWKPTIPVPPPKDDLQLFDISDLIRFVTRNC